MPNLQPTTNKEKSPSKKVSTLFYKSIKDKLVLAFPLLLFVFLGVLFWANTYVLYQQGMLALNPLPKYVSDYSPYPLVKETPEKKLMSVPYLLQAEDFPLLTARAAYILDDNSQVPIFAKNANLRFSLASTTKLMTALTAIDHYKPDDILTIHSDKVEGVVVGFEKGEKVAFVDMLYAMLLPSGNDAAVAIAENYPGGAVAFIGKMNQKAQEYHLYNTHFADSSGLEDSGDYTTAKELARLASVALKNPLVAQIVNTKQTVIKDVTGKNTYVLSNLNRLLGSRGVNGGKTGHTHEAGDVLVTSKMEQGRKIIIVVMNSKDRFVDSSALISFIDNNIIYKSF